MHLNIFMQNSPVAVMYKQTFKKALTLAHKIKGECELVLLAIYLQFSSPPQRVLKQISLRKKKGRIITKHISYLIS